ncbi:MAG: winged helix-turn-helix domain-containing protein [Proteobacteria bacterium]|nr:winged helix-turn-helix domain-containing protein [Pseudomonadota bacterium]
MDLRDGMTDGRDYTLPSAATAASEPAGALPAAQGAPTGALAPIALTPVVLAREPSARLGPLRIEPALRRIAHDDGREVFLEPRVMQLLAALIRAGGQVLSRDQIFAACWPGVVVGEDALNRAVSRLRRLAGEIGAGAFDVETVTKVGYRLTTACAEQAAPPQVAAPERPRLSICVMPFANMSDDPQQAYFSDGISEDIITDLNKVSALFVVARTTAFAFRDAGLDAREAARQLNVSHVLAGSVRREGGRVRITAELIDAASGGQIWAERYDRELTGIFALQDEISEAIVAALKLQLLPEEKQAIEQRGTANLEAYNLYLMARRYYVNGRDGEAPELERIVRLCVRATEIDPSFARAWALLAWGQNALHFIHSRPGEGGLKAAQRALELDPNLAAAHAILARYLWQDGRNEEAKAWVELALELEPDSWEANAEAGRIAYLQHRFEDAARHYERASVLGDPSVNDPAMMMSAYAAMGDTEAMRRAARMALARSERLLARHDSHGVGLSSGVLALAALGEAERMRSWIERALLIGPDNLTMRYNFACAMAAYLGDVEGALELIGPVLAEVSATKLRYVRCDVDLDRLRGHPRFEAMMAAAAARLGVTDS